MRDPVILGTTDPEVPWPVIPLVAENSSIAAAAWQCRHVQRTTPAAPIQIA